MKTTIDNTQRKFLVQSQGLGQRDIFCNLNDIPFILNEYFEVNEEYKIFEYWNRKLKNVGKKWLKELYKENQVNPKQIVKTIYIKSFFWSDKVNGNCYFANEVCVNAGFKSEFNFKIGFDYGGESIAKYETFEQLQKLGILNDVRKYDNGSTESFKDYCDRFNIELTHKCITGCKKSQLKTI